MASGKDRKFAAKEIIDKVKQRLQGWKMKTLSQAGRTTLITSMPPPSHLIKLHLYYSLNKSTLSLML